MTSPKPDAPVQWVEASDWARENFTCDAKNARTGDCCGRPLRWILADATGVGPIAGYCSLHAKQLVTAIGGANVKN